MDHIKAVVFDLYGTLYDVHSVAALCESFYPGRGREISALWRQKQLEYTWLRSLMGRYVHFEDATEDALRYTARHLALEFDAPISDALCDEYLRLSPFPEVPEALRALNDHGLPLAILSNGSSRTIRTVVEHSGLAGAFAHLISVEGAGIFKPDARVYELAERKTAVPRAEILFVSSNAWDIVGGTYFGFTTCWVNRGGATFDEMGRRPDHVATGIDDVARMVSRVEVG